MSGGKASIVLFLCVISAFVLESQLTQYVQTTLGYRHPFFLFYIVHSSLCIIFPLHFLSLIVFAKTTPSDLWHDLSVAIADHLSSPDNSSFSKSPRFRYLCLSVALTVGLSFPGLLWFAAVSLASISDVTAIWNTNAFFAYVIAVKLFGLKWEPKRLLSVVLATLGVLAVVYGGIEGSKPIPQDTRRSVVASSLAPSAPLIGDLLTLVASIGYGLYQVLYKKYAALPTDPEVISERLYHTISGEESENMLRSRDASPDHASRSGAMYPLPFGLHANLLTSTIGVLTFVLLWIPIPVVHYLGIEPFALPSNATTVLVIAGIALSGVAFNAGFMVLLGLWGPIVTSVGSLLTIVLVFISDLLFGIGRESWTLWSVTGCGVIVTAFTVLAYDTFNHS